MARKVDLALPQLGFVVVTRALLGVGLGLLLAERASRRQRRRLALSLLTAGALTTIPALLILRGARRLADASELESAAA